MTNSAATAADHIVLNEQRHIGQALENAEDMMISSLVAIVRATGEQLTATVAYPDGDQVGLVLVEGSRQ